MQTETRKWAVGFREIKVENILVLVWGTEKETPKAQREWGKSLDFFFLSLLFLSSVAFHTQLILQLKPRQGKLLFPLVRLHLQEGGAQLLMFVALPLSFWLMALEASQSPMRTVSYWETKKAKPHTTEKYQWYYREELSRENNKSVY